MWDHLCVFGSFLGMALGGVMAEHFGWRWAFGGMAVFGLILAFLYPIVVKENKIGSIQRKIKIQQKQDKSISPLRSIYSSRSVIATYIGSGLQLFVGGTVIVWLPSYLNRYYGLGTDKAGLVAAMVVLSSAVGTILCGMLCDRLGRESTRPKSQFGDCILFDRLCVAIHRFCHVCRKCSIDHDLYWDVYRFGYQWTIQRNGCQPDTSFCT